MHRHEENRENTIVHESCHATPSPPENKTSESDKECDRPRDSGEQCDNLRQSPLHSEGWSRESLMLETSDQAHNKTDERGRETESSFINESSLLSTSEMNLSIKSENTSDCKDVDKEEKSKGDTDSDGSDLQEKVQTLVKREPSLSPVEESPGGSDGGSANNMQSAPLTFKRSSKSRRRNRSRSRSSSKSVGHSSSPDAPSVSNQSREEAERALVNQLQLPSDVLYLRQQEMNIHGTASVGWVVCCAIPLPQGSSLGPFQGQLVSPEAVKVGDLIVQVRFSLFRHLPAEYHEESKH